MKSLEFLDSLEEHFDKPKFSYEGILNIDDLILYSKISKAIYFQIIICRILIITVVLKLFFYFININQNIRIMIYIIAYILLIIRVVIRRNKVVAKYYQTELKNPLTKLFFYDECFILKKKLEIKVIPFLTIKKTIETKSRIFIKINNIVTPVIINKTKLKKADLDFLRKIGKYKKYDV